MSAYLRKRAEAKGVVLTSAQTCAKYGLTQDEWLAILAGQGWRCPICHKESGTGKYVTDHEHVKGWAQMPDQQRKQYVRGVTCWSCNRYLLARGISVQVARNVAAYLEAYSDRLAAVGDPLADPSSRR